MGLVVNKNITIFPSYGEPGYVIARRLPISRFERGSFWAEEHWIYTLLSTNKDTSQCKLLITSRDRASILMEIHSIEFIDKITWSHLQYLVRK